MDELEARVFALELLVEDILARVPPEIAKDASLRLQRGLTPGTPAAERMVREQALAVLKNARKRDALFTLGAAVIR